MLLFRLFWFFWDDSGYSNRQLYPYSSSSVIIWLLPKILFCKNWSNTLSLGCVLNVLTNPRYWISTNFSSLSSHVISGILPLKKEATYPSSFLPFTLLFRMLATSSIPSACPNLFWKRVKSDSRRDKSCSVTKNFATASFALTSISSSSLSSQSVSRNSSLLRLNAYLAPILLVKMSLRYPSWANFVSIVMAPGVWIEDSLGSSFAKNL